MTPNAQAAGAASRHRADGTAGWGGTARDCHLHTPAHRAQGLCPLRCAAGRWVLARPTSRCSRGEGPLFPSPHPARHAQLGLLKGVHPAVWAGSWAPAAPVWGEHPPHATLPSTCHPPLSPSSGGHTRPPRSSHSCPGGTPAGHQGQPSPAPTSGEAEWRRVQACSSGPRGPKRPLGAAPAGRADERRGRARQRRSGWRSPQGSGPSDLRTRAVGVRVTATPQAKVRAWGRGTLRLGRGSAG